MCCMTEQNERPENERPAQVRRSRRVCDHGKAYRENKGENGAILIIALGVLTLLAILGATFANLMRLEKQATQNYLDSQEVDLINDSALEHVIADLRGAQNWYSFTPYKSHWIYKVLDEDDLAHGLVPLDSPRTKEWEVLFERQQGARVGRYRTKVIDTSAQININGKQDTLGRMLDNLAKAIESSPRLKRGLGNALFDPLFSGPRRSGNRIRGQQIIEFRNKLEGNRFRSKTQLRELIGQENFELIKDFITVESYVDPFTYKPDAGINEILEQGSLSGGRGRGIGSTTDVAQDRVEGTASNISPEPRSPININTAPEEVLIAVLMGIGARRPFPYSKLSYTAIDQSAQVGGVAIPGKEEQADVTPRGVWIYSSSSAGGGDGGGGLDYQFARMIAQRIISERKRTPFVTWSTGDATDGGFVEFINGLEENFFPSHERAITIDPRNFAFSRRIDSEIRKGSSPELSRMWNKGHSSTEAQVRRAVGLPFHQHHAFYYEMIKGAITANANPNSRINRYNPNSPAHVTVDKSDLVRLDRDGRTTRKAYTTEFCFDTNGVFEVTALGQLADRIRGGDAGGPPAASTASSGAGSAGDVRFRPIYQRPMRTVIKVFDVLRHTSQFHFEKTFVTNDRSSRSHRRNIVTFPDSMAALTDVVTGGSLRDGNVSLSNFNDARRNQTPPASRRQIYQANPQVIAAHGFQDRDDASYNQLRRLQGVGGAAGQAFNDELRKVFNFPYARKGKLLQDIYTSQELKTGLGYLDQFQINNDPQVNTETIGSDLFPDGFNMSLFRSSHLGGRFLMLPAHQRMGTSTRGGPGVQVGAGFRQDVNGNVAYYNGGLAFWVKFEFDGDDPVFSGLIGCTQVVEDVGQKPQDSEGSQFYIFKNTDGWLRIVRMYYHQAFPEGGSGEGGDGGGSELWPPVGTGEETGGTNTPGENPILEFLDDRKIVARADYLIDVRKIRAREWHHIAVDWNDSTPAQALQVHFDFEKHEGGGPYVRQEETGDRPTAWTRLNCRRPRDELFIGGFIRSQGAAEFGVFKWFTNITEATAGQGISVVRESLKRILANATIDEFITYEGTFPSVRNYYGTGGVQGYFSHQPGEYANVFEVPLPPEVDSVALRSFDWTAYYPAMFTTHDGQVHRVNTQHMRCQITTGRTNIAPFDEPWGVSRRTAWNPVSNKILQRRESKGLIGMNAELVYQFNIFPGKVQSGSLAGGSVHSPVLDDVTLTYFLPVPKILLQEEAEEGLIRDPRARNYRAE